jgi:hypothetical protein
VDEYDSLQVKFANTFKTETTFTKAMTFISQGNLTEAKKLLESLKTMKNSKDFLVNPVVGVDPFLIAISPQVEGKYAELADAIEGGVMPVSFKVYLDGELFNLKKRYLKKGGEHFLTVKCFNIDGDLVSSSDSFSLFINGEKIDSEKQISTDSPGKFNWSVKFISSDGLLQFSKSIKFVVYEFKILETSMQWFDPYNSISDNRCIIKFQLIPKIFNPEVIITDFEGKLVFVSPLLSPYSHEFIWDGTGNQQKENLTGWDNPYIVNITAHSATDRTILEADNPHKLYLVPYLPIGSEKTIPFRCVSEDGTCWVRFRKPTSYKGKFDLAINGTVGDCVYFKEGISLGYEYSNSNPCEFPKMSSLISCYAKMQLKSEINLKIDFFQEYKTPEKSKPRAVWFWSLQSIPEIKNMLLHDDNGPLASYDSIFKTNTKEKEIEFVNSNPQTTGRCDGATFLSMNYNHVLEFKDKYKDTFNHPNNKGQDMLEGLLCSFFARKPLMKRLNTSVSVLFNPTSAPYPALHNLTGEDKSLYARAWQTPLEKHFCDDSNEERSMLFADFGPLKTGDSITGPNNVVIYNYRCDYEEKSPDGQYGVTTQLDFVDHHKWPSDALSERKVKYLFILWFDNRGEIMKLVNPNGKVLDKNLHKWISIVFDEENYKYLGRLPKFMIDTDKIKYDPENSTIKKKHLEDLFKDITIGIVE